jgi:two-component system chemotaxis sensor kinase CheA
MMVGKLRLQKVLLLEVQPDELLALAPAGPARPLPAAVGALLEAQPSGCCNDPGAAQPDGVTMLAETLGLHRFMWSRIARPDRAPILIVAGFDPQKAVFQSPFGDGDVARFSNAAQQMQSLLGNALLIAELERERNQLEQRVQERTHELAVRNRDLRLVLDTVDQALLTVDLQGRLDPERSSMADAWFGSYTGSPQFIDHVGAERRFRALFELGLSALRDDILPRELCLYQMPKRLNRGARQFDCRYLPIEEGDQLLGLLLVISDVTELLARTREDAEQRELLAAFMAFTRDRNGFLTFFEEARRIFEQLELGAGDRALEKQLLHTLKGSSASFGLQRISELCHVAESALAQEQSAEEALHVLRARWRLVVDTLQAAAPHEQGRTIELSEQRLEQLAEQARQGASPGQLLQELRCLGWESNERSLERLARHAETLARRLGKDGLGVEVHADRTRLDPQRWAPLWSALTHVVRNAVDHGIEPTEQRLAAGKPAQGLLRLRAGRVEQQYRVEIEDDGAGIDWSAVQQRCRAQGLPCSTHEDLLAALLSPDFSTRREISETSGRGVGLAVLDAAVRGLHGRLAVESAPQRGTRWILTFPDLGASVAEPLD